MIVGFNGGDYNSGSIEGNEISGNSTAGNGGGIFLNSVGEHTIISINNNNIYGNTAPSGSGNGVQLYNNEEYPPKVNAQNNWWGTATPTTTEVWSLNTNVDASSAASGPFSVPPAPNI